jgi:Oligosaccharyltransferase 48 kDa subunit beta
VKSGNKQFSRDIAAWTFQESLVLRIDRTEHHRVNSTEPLEQYTTNDQLVSFVLVPQCVILRPSLTLGVQYLHLKIQFEERCMGTFFWLARPSTRIYHA